MKNGAETHCAKLRAKSKVKENIFMNKQTYDFKFRRIEEQKIQ